MHSPSQASFSDLNEMFSYSHKSPLNIEEAGVEYKNDISVHDISYAGLKGGRIGAYLVVPPGNGPFAAAVFVHPGPGSRSSFLDEALILAKAKAVCLLIDAPWANGPEFGKRASGRPEDVRDWFIEIAIDLRRAVDLISSLPNVDINRIAYRRPQSGRSFWRNTVWSGQEDKGQRANGGRRKLHRCSPTEHAHPCRKRAGKI